MVEVMMLAGPREEQWGKGHETEGQKCPGS